MQRRLELGHEVHSAVASTVGNESDRAASFGDVVRAGGFEERLVRRISFPQRPPALTIEFMKAVSAEVVMAKLSEILRLVKAGETILVTERGEVIAEIHPARQRLGEPSLEEKLAAMAARGELTLSSRPIRRDWTEFLNAMPPVGGVDVRKTLDVLKADTEDSHE